MSNDSEISQLTAVTENYDEYYQTIKLTGCGSGGQVYFAHKKGLMDSLSAEVYAVKIAFNTRVAVAALHRIRTEILTRKKIIERSSGVQEDGGFPIARHLVQMYMYRLPEEEEPWTVFGEEIMAWYSMEALTRGITIRSILSHQNHYPYPKELVLHIAYQLAMVTRYLHTRCNLVHGDLTKENIMLRMPGKECKNLPDIVLIDFAFSNHANGDATSVAENLEINRMHLVIGDILSATWKPSSPSNQDSEGYKLMKRLCNEEAPLDKTISSLETVVQEARNQVAGNEQTALEIVDLLNAAHRTNFMALHGET